MLAKELLENTVMCCPEPTYALPAHELFPQRGAFTTMRKNPNSSSHRNLPLAYSFTDFAHCRSIDDSKALDLSSA